jgi:hypothetical protein
MIDVKFQISARAWPPKTMYCNEAQSVFVWSFHNEPSGLFNGLIGHSELTELKGLVVHHKLIKLIKGFVGHSKLTKLTSLIHAGHIKLFKLIRLIVGSSSGGAQISKLIVNYISIPSSEGAR